MKASEFMQTRSIGETLAANIVSGFADQSPEIDQLLSFIEIVADRDLKKVTTVLSGKSVLFTGTLHAIDRKVAQEMVRTLGGKVASTVSQELNYLVVGSELWAEYNSGLLMSGKLKKARQAMDKGAPIQIISEDEFFQMIKSE
jgi:NAD-dependent DNA ligase